MYLNLSVYLVFNMSVGQVESVSKINTGITAQFRDTKVKLISLSRMYVCSKIILDNIE